MGWIDKLGWIDKNSQPNSTQPMYTTRLQLSFYLYLLYSQDIFEASLMGAFGSH